MDPLLPSETYDAGRAALALVRAHHNDDQAGRDAILATAELPLVIDALAGQLLGLMRAYAAGLGVAERDTDAIIERQLAEMLHREDGDYGLAPGKH